MDKKSRRLVFSHCWRRATKKKKKKERDGMEMVHIYPTNNPRASLTLTHHIPSTRSELPAGHSATVMRRNAVAHRPYIIMDR